MLLNKQLQSELRAKSVSQGDNTAMPPPDPFPPNAAAYRKSLSKSAPRTGLRTKKQLKSVNLAFFNFISVNIDLNDNNLFNFKLISKRSLQWRRIIFENFLSKNLENLFYCILFHKVNLIILFPTS